MRIGGIIAEFDPFHNGHAFLIDSVKKRGFDAVVCVMSGEFVQRGAYAIASKRARAQAAICGGADLILSLPFPWSCAGAEYFASASVSILCRLGVVDALCFGSECGDLQKLQRCTDILDGISRESVRQIQKEQPQLSFIQAREILLTERLGEQDAALLRLPNNLLGVEYLRALKNENAPIEPLTILRQGTSHKETTPSASVASSSYIRERLALGDPASVRDLMPKAACSALETEYRFVDEDRYFTLLCGAVLSRQPEELSQIAEIGGGMEYALYRELLCHNDYPSLFDALRARHLTDAKIRRSLLFASLGVPQRALRESPLFTEVLAANDTGKAILAQLRNSEPDIALLSKSGAIRKCSSNAQAQFKRQRRSEIVFSKLLKPTLSGSSKS